jgi:hypothetical protein
MSRVEALGTILDGLNLPKNLASLYSFCVEKKAINLKSTLFMVPGNNMTTVSTSQRSRIDSTYGMELYHEMTGERLATCGFNIESDVMFISATPQGKKHELFSSRKIRRSFARSKFKYEMMEAMINLAKLLNLKGIKANSALKNPIDDLGLATMKTLARSKDELLEFFGYKLIEEEGEKSFYYLNLI